MQGDNAIADGPCGDPADYPCEEDRLRCVDVEGGCPASSFWPSTIASSQIEMDKQHFAR